MLLVVIVLVRVPIDGGWHFRLCRGGGATRGFVALLAGQPLGAPFRSSFMWQ